MAKRMPFPERFWIKVDRAGGPDACWPWLASLNTSGYGQFHIGRRPDRRVVLASAHRVAYELLIGSIPDGLMIDHLCRNRVCVNPAHLEPVTQAENVRRGQSGQNSRDKTHCPHGHPYEGDNVYRFASRPNARYCRTCKNTRWGHVPPTAVCP